MRPLIGILGRTDKSTKQRSTICVFENYRIAVIKAGGNPIAILPPQEFDYDKTLPKDAGHLKIEEKEMLDAQLKLCDGFIVQGGNRAYDYDRYVINYANQNHIPLLGICLGMQLMCNYNNDNQNMANIDPMHNYKHLDYVHDITLDKNSKLYSIIGKETFQVNSMHNYHVPNSGDYEIAGYSSDHIIEAVEKKVDLFNIGLQWHPEKNYDTDEISQKIFKAFINATKLKRDE